MLRKGLICGPSARLIASFGRNGKPKQSTQLFMHPADGRAAVADAMHDCVARVIRNARFLLLAHMPDHKVVMRHVHSSVACVEVNGDVVDWSGEPRRLQ